MITFQYLLELMRQLIEWKFKITISKQKLSIKVEAVNYIFLGVASQRIEVTKDS